MAFQAYQRETVHGGGLLAGGLAYRLFLWILPFALTVATAARLFTAPSGRPLDELARERGMSRAVVSLVSQISAESQRSAVLLFGAGAVVMLWMGLAVFRAFRIVSGIVWGVHPRRPSQPLVAAAVTSGVLAALVVEGTVVSFVFDGLGLFWLALIDGAIFVAVATWGCLVLPHPDGVGIRDALPGALVFTVGAGALGVFTRLYLAGRIDAANNLYGALGLATVFLLWLYIFARVIVAGLALNATIWQYRSMRDEASQPE